MKRLILCVLLCGCSAAGLLAPAPSGVAAWGDSITHGTGAAAGESYPDVLSRLLNRPVYNGGVPGETSSQILARILADTTHRRDVAILWMGTNNSYSPAQIVADVDTAVAHLSTTHFLVIGPENRPYEYAGRVEYAVVTEAGRQLAVKYPDHYVDIRAYLVSQYDPTNAEDVTDHALDVPPSSLRFDDVHLNARGDALVAAKLNDVIRGKGW